MKNSNSELSAGIIEVLFNDADTKKVNKKTLDKNKTKKHKINNKGGIKIGNMKVDITKNLEKARDYFKPHENAGKKCGDDNDCKLQLHLLKLLLKYY